MIQARELWSSRAFFIYLIYIIGQNKTFSEIYHF